MESSISAVTFKGSIPEAILESKKQRKLFVVYISGIFPFLLVLLRNYANFTENLSGRISTVGFAGPAWLNALLSLFLYEKMCKNLHYSEGKEVMM